MRYCTRAAFWLDRNTQAFGAGAGLTVRHGPPFARSAQNSCTRSASGFSWSRSPGKYCPFNSQPSTNAIRPPERQSTFTCRIVTSITWSGSATKLKDGAKSTNPGSFGVAQPVGSLVQHRPCTERMVQRGRHMVRSGRKLVDGMVQAVVHPGRRHL
uniref:Uncharacterized protein n=1 Tax=Anopheles atroparvus TaxID=41427 RepID=A0A182JH49_ANOAO